MKHKHRVRTMARGPRIVAAAVTSVLLLAAFGLLTVVRMPALVVDAVPGNASGSHRIVQQQLESYCPAGMALPDSTDWGDSEYRASSGDLDTATAFAAFGSVYASSLTAMDAASDAAPESLKAPDKPVSADAMVFRDAHSGSRLLATGLLEAGDGSGHAGTILSHASKGDLKGVSATSCVTPAMRQSFLLPATSTGSSQRLVLANPSSKATTVSITVVGTKASGPVGLSTAGTATVAAGGETTVDLTAAAGGQDGLYVTVDSGSTPLAAVVRVITLDGLTPKGSDFAMPVGEASKTYVIAGVDDGDDVTLYLHGDKATRADVSWITEDGLKHVRGERVQADRVGVFDLGKAPEGARGLLVSGDGLVAAAKATRSGAGRQEDFALLAASAPTASSGVALPDGVESTLVFTNASDREARVFVTFMDDDGHAGDPKTVTVDAHAAATVRAEGSAAEVTDADRSVTWAARFTDPGLDKTRTAGLSVLAPTALSVREETVVATPDASIVH